MIENDVLITWLDFGRILWKIDVVIDLCSSGHFDLVSKISQKSIKTRVLKFCIVIGNDVFIILLDF